MNTLDTSATAWRAQPQLAMAPAAAPPQARDPIPGDAAVEDGFRIFGNDGFTFLDFVDIINPLQHIPFLSTFYRDMTGDEIDPGSRVLGSTLFFGPVGTVASLANVLVEDRTGKDVGEHVMAFFDEDADGRPEPIKTGDGSAGPVVAMNAPPAAATGAQTGAVDPVTAWAQSEMVYRNSVSRKHQAAMEIPATVERHPAQAIEAAAAGAAWERGATLTVESAPGPALGSTPSGAIHVAAVTGRLRGEARIRAADGYGVPRPASGPVVGAKERAPDGAVAPAGGWFSETMVTALERYQDTAVRPGAKPVPIIDLKR